MRMRKARRSGVPKWNRLASFGKIGFHFPDIPEQSLASHKEGVGPRRYSSYTAISKPGLLPLPEAPFAGKFRRLSQGIPPEKPPPIAGEGKHASQISVPLIATPLRTTAYLHASTHEG